MLSFKFILKFEFTWILNEFPLFIEGDDLTSI